MHNLKCSCAHAAQRQQTNFLFKSKKQAMKGSIKPYFSDFKINIIKELCRNFNQTTKTLFIFCLKNLSLETLQLTNKTKTWKAITIILHKSCMALVFLIVRPPSKFDFSDNFVSKNPAQIYKTLRAGPAEG